MSTLKAVASGDLLESSDLVAGTAHAELGQANQFRQGALQVGAEGLLDCLLPDHLQRERHQLGPGETQLAGEVECLQLSGGDHRRTSDSSSPRNVAATERE